MDQERADQKHRRWLTTALETAAAQQGLEISGPVVFGWKDRSIGAPAGRGPAREQRWIRIVTEHVSWAHGDWWTGNQDASSITGIRKPQVLATREWQDGNRRLRMEVMTYIPGKTCSDTPELSQDLELPDDWWSELARSLNQVRQTPTQRVAVPQELIERRLGVFYGNQVNSRVTRWETAHADLNWANLTGPQLGLLDWELWGLAPAGYDPATLYCYSLLSPTTAAKVRDTFSEGLDSPDGTLAQLYVIARLLLRAEKGDHPNLVVPLHRHKQELLGKFAGST